MTNVFRSSEAAALFHSNGNPYGWIKNILLAGNERIKRPDLYPDKFLFGYIPYEYKNQVENLTSRNEDYFGFGDEVCFYKAEEALINPGFDLKNHTAFSKLSPLQTHCLTTREEYFENVEKIKRHIQLGDIYEMNYCISFRAENVSLDPFNLFLHFNRATQAPYACLLKSGDRYLISASPECFLKKRGNRLSSHPIKGTAARNHHPPADQELKKRLLLDPKERSENIMITDLVRNDLSKIAAKGSVRVDELCKVYSFPTVHQLISSVSCELKEDISFRDIIHATFPMGSMTGAPKIKAMELIDEYENFSRELYSGSAGFIQPDGNFDFNVVIRSILYNSEKKQLSFSAGSAITAYCSAEKEYNECMLKANAMMNALTGK